MVDHRMALVSYVRASGELCLVQNAFYTHSRLSQCSMEVTPVFELSGRVKGFELHRISPSAR